MSLIGTIGQKVWGLINPFTTRETQQELIEATTLPGPVETLDIGAQFAFSKFKDGWDQAVEAVRNLGKKPVSNSDQIAEMDGQLSDNATLPATKQNSKLRR